MVGSDIKRLRKALGENQTQFGARFDVVQQTVAHWEKGHPPAEHQDQLRALMRENGIDETASVPNTISTNASGGEIDYLRGQLDEARRVYETMLARIERSLTAVENELSSKGQARGSLHSGRRVHSTG